MRPPAYVPANERDQDAIFGRKPARAALSAVPALDSQAIRFAIEIVEPDPARGRTSVTGHGTREEVAAALEKAAADLRAVAPEQQGAAS